MKTSLIKLILVAGLVVTGWASQAQDANFTKTDMLFEGGVISTSVSGNFTWNRFLFEETDQDDPQPVGYRLELYRQEYASLASVSGPAVKALAEQRALDALSNAIFEEPVANDVCIDPGKKNK